MSVELLERAPASRPHTGGPEGGTRDPGGRGDGPGPGGIAGDPALFGLWAFLGTVSMLFVGFTSAYLARRAAVDWRPLPAPPLLWANTAALLLSSGALEVARRRLRAWDWPTAKRYLVLSAGLGGLFLAGQVAAWRWLAERGVFLASNPHSSFFYILTGIHGVHLIGGLVWFAVTLLTLRRLPPAASDGLRRLATYWHFLAALWLYLLVLLFAV